MPKYVQLRDLLLELVTSELAVDEPIPSERELKRRLKLSRMTVRQAIDHLVAEGRPLPGAGKGTFVARPKIVMSLHLASFTEDMLTRGLTPGSTELGRRTIEAGRRLGDLLGLANEEQVYVFDRLRLADAADAWLLGIAIGSATLLLGRRSFSGDVPVEYAVSIYRGDRYQLHVALSSPTSGGDT